MILTVTANPAHDVTHEVDALAPGQVHRVRAVHARPGGKGLNVAAVLAALGEEVTATGLCDPAFAALMAQSPDLQGVRCDFVAALPHVRRTVAVVEPDGRTTSLWEPGPAAPADAADQLLAHVRRLLADATALVVSGSLPGGLDASLIAALARSATDAGVPTVLDTSGAGLAAAAEVPGVVLMPNADELIELTGSPVGADATEVAAAAQPLLDRGVRAVVATRGSAGLVVITAEGTWQVTPPRSVTGNPTGAGDAAAAAVARGLAHDDAWPVIAEAAVAVSAAAVATPVAGRIDARVLSEFEAAVAATHVTRSP